MAKKKLNKNLVITLSLCAFGAMIALAIVMLNRLQQRDPQYFVQLAEEQENAGQWEKAGLFYNEAWRRSEDPVYLARLSKMLLKNGDVLNALTGWERALVNRPDLIEAHRNRLEVLLELAQLNGRLSDWERARDAAEQMATVVATKTPEDQAYALHAKGLALGALKSQNPSNEAHGLAALEDAMKTAPDNVDYSVDVAMELARQKRDEDGERILRELLQKHPGSGAEGSKVRVAYARFQAAIGKLDDSDKLFQDAISFAGGDLKAMREARLAYAMLLAQRWAVAKRRGKDLEAAEQRFSQAETIFKQAIEAEPDSYDPYVQLALLYKSGSREADVVGTCDKRLQRGLTRKGIDASRNRVNTFRLMIYASEACVSEALEAQAKNDSAAMERELARAEQYVTDAKGEFPNHPRMLSQLGKIKVSRTQYRAALAELREADEAYRSFDAIDWDNKILLARVHLQLEEGGAAKAVFEEVLEQARRDRPSDEALWTVYAQALFKTDELDQAMAYTDRVLLVSPDNREATQLKAAILERRGKGDEAAKIVEQSTGDKVTAALLSARQRVLEGDSDGAIGVLRDALQANPNDGRLVSALANELVERGRADEAQRIVGEALKAKPDDVQLKRLSVSVRPDLSDDARFDALLELAKSQPDGFQRSLDLISLYLGKKENAKALEAINQAEAHLVQRDTPAARAASITQHRAMLRAKVHLAAQLDDQAAMDAARASAIQQNVDGAGGKSIVGLYHMARKEFELATNAFRDVLASQPTDSWTLAHLGQCLQLMNRADEAQSAYERALRANPSEALAHRGLAMLAKLRNDTETYERHLARCAETLSKDAWVSAELLAKKEQADPASAIRRREAELASAPDDMENLQRLVSLCEAAKDTTKGDQHLAKLVALHGDNPAVVSSAGAYYRRTGRVDRSHELVQRFLQSRKSAKDRAVALLIMAEHYSNARQPDEAEKALLAAAEADDTVDIDEALSRFYLQTATQPAKAIPWLDRAIEKARTAEPQRLPQLLVTRIYSRLHRFVNDLEGARKDVDELITAFPDDPRGLLWQSEMHARSGRIGPAVASLTDYLAKRPTDPYARFQRAQYYLSQGQTNQAFDDLESIKSTDPLALQLEPRILLAKMYERVGRREQCIQELEALASDAPDSTRALEELVNAYLRAGRAADADRVVAARLNRPGEKPQPDWLFLRGKVSLSINEVDKALADFQRGTELTGYSAESMTKALEAYANVGRFAEGASYYEQHTKGEVKSPLLRSHYALLLMRSGQKARAVDEFRGAMALATAEPSDMALRVPGDLRRAVPDRATMDEAITLFERNVPSGALGRANDRLLVRLYRWSDRTMDAAAKLDKLTQSASDTKEKALLLQEKGEIHQMAKENAEARAAYEEALKYDPDSWATLNNLAYLLSDQLGESKEAEKYAQRAVSINENPALLDTLGWIYVALGRYPDAVAELSQAVRIDPTVALYHYHLGEAYRRNGQTTEALTILQAGRGVAAAAKDTALVQQIDRSLERIQRGDRSP